MTMTTPNQEVIKKAAQFGFTLSPSEVQGILWGATGFPGFWPDKKKTPLQNLQKQLYDFFADAKRTSLYAALMAREP